MRVPSRFSVSLLACVALLATSRCGKEPPVAPSVPRPPTSTGRPEVVAGPLRAELVAGAEPNQYEVRVRYSGAGPADRCRVERVAGRAKAVTLFVGACDDGDVIDKSPPLGTTARYELVAVRGEAGERVAQVPIAIPRDLEVRGIVPAERIDHVARLFLRKDGVLYSDGRELVIDVEEIHAQGGTITTFQPAAERAAEGKAGNAAGPITVRADRAVGRLRLLLAGQHGGEGKGGAPGDAGMARLRFLEVGTAGGQGRPGGPGSDGGASPRFLLVVDDASALVVEDKVIPGAGGPGGKGGPGGRGGASGPAALGATSGGPNGPTGQPGIDGVAGKPGAESPRCFFLSGVRYHRCEEFAAELRALVR